MNSRILRRYLTAGLVSLSTSTTAWATIYEVGPGKSHSNIGNVTWESLQPGDTVLIYWRSEAYNEKWVIARQGTASQPNTVSGVPGPNGELPIMDGNGAITRLVLDYWSETRGGHQSWRIQYSRRHNGAIYRYRKSRNPWCPQFKSIC